MQKPWKRFTFKYFDYVAIFHLLLKLSLLNNAVEDSLYSSLSESF